MSLESLLKQRLVKAFGAVAGSAVDPVLHRSQHADYQADGALALARKMGRSPREVAAQVVEKAALSDVCASIEVAGPGFINLNVSDTVLGELTTRMIADPRLGVARSAKPEIVVVDYSAPNAAKEMHVGHLRSTVIGDATVRLLEWRGHTVIRQNHLGDWGTPFGMLIEHLVDIGEDEAAHELLVGDLSGFYQAARKKFDADERFADRARRRVVLLQQGDEPTLRLWQVLVEQSIRYFMAVYERLEVKLAEADFAGESGYNEQLGAIVAELTALGLLRESDGALCLFPDGFQNREGTRMPLIVRKTDGGYGYATTDLAAIRHRIHELGATRLVYVVGLPQALHLQMVFQAAREAGWATPAVRTEHVGFGSVLGPDGKILRTRAGVSVKLIDLLDEAISRAAAAVQEKSRDLTPEQAAHAARAVGIGAIKYADLASIRTKDYVFDYDRMLSFDGNTGPYLQYAHARICSLLRKAATSIDAEIGPVCITAPVEHALSLELLAFGGLVNEVEESLDFHRLCGYLYSLATAFTDFYESCPVINAEAGIKTSRLALCALTARTLSSGLSLLGITAPDRM